MRLGGVAGTHGDVGWAGRLRMLVYIVAGVEVHRCEDTLHELPQRVAPAGGDHEVVGRFVLHDPPHRIDVFRCPAPVALHAQVAKRHTLPRAGGDATRRLHHLACHEPLRAKRRLVIEQDPGARMEPVGLAVVGDGVVGGRLGRGVRAAGPERRRLVGWCRRVAKHLARPGAVKPHRLLEQSNALEQVHRRDRDAVEGFQRLAKRQADRRLPRQVIDLVDLDVPQKREHAAEVGRRHRVDIDTVRDAQRPEGGKGGPVGISGRAVNFVALFEQQAGEISTILPRHAADQRLLYGLLHGCQPGA